MAVSAAPLKLRATAAGAEAFARVMVSDTCVTGDIRDTWKFRLQCAASAEARGRGSAASAVVWGSG